MRILGIDPGLDTTGYGCVIASGGDTVQLVEGGVVRSAAHAPMEQRLHELHRGLADVCRELAPDVMVVEEIYAHYAHPRTAILMAHARGVFYLAAGQQQQAKPSLAWAAGGAGGSRCRPAGPA